VRKGCLGHSARFHVLEGIKNEEKRVAANLVKCAILLDLNSKLRSANYPGTLQSPLFFFQLPGRSSV